MTSKVWTEDRPVVSPPFLFYRQVEDGPMICIPVTQEDHMVRKGRKYESAVKAAGDYPNAYSIIIIFDDKSEGEYFPTHSFDGPILACFHT